MFPEGAYTKQAAGTTMNVGWSPVVTGVLTLHDGGKAMCGFGKVSGTTLKAWLVKMWSGSGTYKCNSNAATTVNHITGYVTMKPIVLSATRTTSQACNLTSNAYVDWFTGTHTSGTYAITDLTSEVFLALAEDMASGNGTSANAYIVCAGGKSEWANYGLGDYVANLVAYNNDGTS